MRDRVAIARRASKATDGAGGTGEETVVGIALWATVLHAVDAKLGEGPQSALSGRWPRGSR
jgi:hypothetical protein